jgi:hypothetical protein
MNNDNGNCAAVVFGVSGANTASPFDGNPRTHTGTPTSSPNEETMAVTTSYANDFIIGAVGVESSSTSGLVPPPTQNGFDSILTRTAGTSRYVSTEYRIVSSTGTYNPRFAWNSNYDVYSALIVDAIKKGP